MAHMEHEKNRHAWDGAQIPFIGFDQLEHFTARQFFYMLSRNRTTIGVKPRICATCNPDPDSFLARFLAWWIDEETGYPFPERSGQVRYFIRDGDEIVWGNSRGEIAEALPHLIAHDPDTEIKSITFIESYMEDNPISLEATGCTFRQTPAIRSSGPGRSQPKPKRATSNSSREDGTRPI